MASPSMRGALRRPRFTAGVAAAGFAFALACSVLLLGGLPAPARAGREATKVETKARKEGWHLGEVPNPFEHPKTCGLARPGALCDPDGLLSAEGREKVASVLQAIRDSTSVRCPDGTERSFQVGAALVQRMHPSDWGAGGKEAAAQHFAREIGDRWGVGDPGCDNGVLLFLSLGDRYAYVRTAKVSQQVLTDSLSTIVVDNMKPILREELYDKAVLQATLQINDVLQGKEIPGASSGFWETWGGSLFAVALFGFYFFPVAMMVLCMLLRCVLTPAAYLMDAASSCCASRRASRQAHSDLQRVQRELDRDEFDQSMCPICLEAFEDPGPGSVALECRHRFHRTCIDPWMNDHASCPLCRADVPAPLAPEDEDQPQEYQRRLRFYLSRLQRRHPRFFPGTSDSAVYRRDRSGNWMLYNYALGGRGAHHAPTAAASYMASLEARYASAMRSSRSAWESMAASSRGGGHSGGSSSFGGGGGFSGGGGGGGGW